MAFLLNQIPTSKGDNTKYFKKGHKWIASLTYTLNAKRDFVWITQVVVYYLYTVPSMVMSLHCFYQFIIINVYFLVVH